MSFFKTGHGQIITAMMICLTISIAFNINISAKNKKYEKYLSEQIGNTLKPMGADMNEAKLLLDKANRSGYISKDDLYSLYNYHLQFILGIQDLFHMYEVTVKGNYRPLYGTSKYFLLYNELSSLNKEVQQKNQSIYKITSADKTLFSQMQKITDEFAHIFDADYFSWNFSISDDRWIDTIKQIDSVSIRTFD